MKSSLQMYLSSFSLSSADLMAEKWPSRCWSCSEMMRGAAQVVDHMALPADDLQALKEGILSATSHLDEQQIEALLQDNVSMFVSCTLTRPLPTWKPSSRRQSRRLRRTSGAAR